MNSETDLSECRAFHILHGLQFASQLLSHLIGDWLLTVLGKLLHGCRVVAQVNLGTNEQERRTLAVVSYLRNPLYTHTQLEYQTTRQNGATTRQTQTTQCLYYLNPHSATHLLAGPWEFDHSRPIHSSSSKSLRVT